MEIIDIIKEAMVYPSNDLAKLAIYIALSFAIGILFILGLVLFALGVSENAVFAVIGVILFIGALVVSFILSGYLISIVKSGIDGDEDLPEFIWKENLITGVKYLVVNIVYFIIPAIIVLIIGAATNLFGLAAEVISKTVNASVQAQANSTVVASNVVPQATMTSFLTAFSITAIIAAVVFLIFLFIETMAEARLANTGNIGDALNIPEAFKDIGRIGWGKVIAVVFLIFIIIAVINSVISGLNYYISGISIISLIVTPYLTFFASRATGLLYSDIA
ncbi:DUF4013 domain-containing protein [uncultured Methanobrevibacter sp.]|uniref:DUF4013 domain-containing protein n=1 Tax=uncultured Methanobrevibacter sp. TaxID=253161 RepID=UPI0025EED2C0|nr:DUF4013 domain-containing protein [uncultured Methanobrevibacter sp.]